MKNIAIDDRLLISTENGFKHNFHEIKDLISRS